MEKPNFENIFLGYTYINCELTQITLDNNNNESNTRVTTHTKQNNPAFTTSNSNNNNDKKKLINHNGLVIPLSPMSHLSQRNIP